MEDQRPIVKCEECGGPTHEEDILTTDGLMPHLVCDCCGYQWVPESVYYPSEDDLMFDQLSRLPINRPNPDMRKRGKKRKGDIMPTLIIEKLWKIHIDNFEGDEHLTPRCHWCGKELDFDKIKNPITANETGWFYCSDKCCKEDVEYSKPEGGY